MSVEKQTFRNNLLLAIGMVSLLLISCGRSDVQVTEGGGNGQSTVPQQQSSSLPNTTSLGQNTSNSSVAKEPQINLVREFAVSRADGQVTSLKREFKTMITGSQSGATEKSIIAFSADPDCNLCLAAARKLVEMAQGNSFSEQKCKLMVFVDATSTGSDALRSFSESVGVGSSAYLFRLTEPGMTNASMMSAFQKSKPSGPYVAVMTWSPAGDVRVSMDSSAEGVGKPFYDSLINHCR